MAIDPKKYPNKIKSNLWADTQYVKYFYNFKFEDKKYRGIVDLTDKKGWNKRDRITYAEAKLIEIKNSKRDQVPDSNITLNAYMQKTYFHLMQESNWKHTKQSWYDRMIKPYIGKKKMCDITQKHIRECIKKQENEGYKPRTIKQTIEVLNPAYQNAISERIVKYNPCTGIKIKLPPSKKIVIDADKKLMEIYSAIMEEFKGDPFYLAFYLFAMQGRRKSEIINLNVENISFEHNYYVLRTTKGNEEQKFYLPQAIKLLLLQFVNKSGPVFISGRTGRRIVNVNKRTIKLKERLGWNFTLHYCRNVITSAMGQYGDEPTHLSGALGHSNAGTIDKYLTLDYMRGSKKASERIDSILFDNLHTQ